MIFGSIGRALVRYFRRPATSVPPQTAWSAPEDITSWSRPGTTFVRELHPGEDAKQAIADHIAGTAIKPPTQWTWEAWAKEFGSLAIAGWSPCQFAHRAGREGPEKAIFVFGVVRGAFGLWQQPFDVWFFGDDIPEVRRDTLTIVTHLRSGVGLGIFAEKEGAAQACALASATAPWETVEQGSADWTAAFQRSAMAWHQMGIVPSVNAHAHDPDTGCGPFPIMGLSAESAAVGKPEKLS